MSTVTLMAVVSHGPLAANETRSAGPGGTLIMVLVLTFALLAWVSRLLRTDDSVVGGIERMVIRRAVARMVIVGALVLVAVAALVH